MSSALWNSDLFLNNPGFLQNIMEQKRIESLYEAAYALCRAFIGVRYRPRYSGAENIPHSGPALILPKHQKMDDIILEGLFLMRNMGRAAYWVMKSGLPSALSYLGGISVVRPCEFHSIKDKAARRKAIQDARQLNQNAKSYVEWLYMQGELVVVHPEGTRSPGKTGEVREEHISLARIVQEEQGIKIPAIPMGIEYSKTGEVFVRAGKPLDVSQPGIAEIVKNEISRLSNIR